MWHDHFFPWDPIFENPVCFRVNKISYQIFLVNFLLIIFLAIFQCIGFLKLWSCCWCTTIIRSASISCRNSWGRRFFEPGLHPTVLPSRDYDARLLRVCFSVRDAHASWTNIRLRTHYEALFIFSCFRLSTWSLCRGTRLGSIFQVERFFFIRGNKVVN